MKCKMRKHEGKDGKNVEKKSPTALIVVIFSSHGGHLFFFFFFFENACNRTDKRPLERFFIVAMNQFSS